MKKIISLVLSCAMLISVVACSSKNTKETANIEINKTGFPITQKPITIKMMGLSLPNQAEWENMIFFKEMEKLTNIKFTFQNVSVDSFAEKKNLAFASGTIPDVFYGGITPQDESEYGSAKVLIPLNKYFEEYAPNLLKLLNERAEIKRTIALDDGNIYSFPYINDVPRDMTNKYWINLKWLKKLSLDVPTTTEEYYNVLKAFKNNDPNGNGIKDELPLSVAGLNALDDLFGAFGFVGRSVFVDDNDKVVFAPMLPEYKQALKYLRMLYAEGLIDSESSIQTFQQMTAKGSDKTERLGSFMGPGAFVTVGNDRNQDYVALPALKGSEHKPIWPQFDSVVRGMFAITSECKYPEAVVRYIDYLYSEEGAKLLRQGVKGVNYKEYPDGSWEQIIPEGAGKDEARAHITPASSGIAPSVSPLKFILAERETVPLNSTINKETEKLIPYFRKAFPSITFSNTVQKDINALHADISNYVNQSFAKFVVGDMNIDAEWDNYLSQLNKMKVAEYVEIYSKAYISYKQR